MKYVDLDTYSESLITFINSKIYSNEYIERLTFYYKLVKFYSGSNTCNIEWFNFLAIYYQKYDATFVKSISQWKNYLAVNDLEWLIENEQQFLPISSAIGILAPIYDEKDRVLWTKKLVYDVSQFTKISEKITKQPNIYEKINDEGLDEKGEDITNINTYINYVTINYFVDDFFKSNNLFKNYNKKQIAIFKEFIIYNLVQVANVDIDYDFSMHIDNTIFSNSLGYIHDLFLILKLLPKYLRSKIKNHKKELVESLKIQTIINRSNRKLKERIIDSKLKMELFECMNE